MKSTSKCKKIDGRIIYHTRLRALVVFMHIRDKDGERMYYIHEFTIDKFVYLRFSEFISHAGTLVSST
jgi:hypothetical protein